MLRSEIIVTACATCARCGKAESSTGTSWVTKTSFTRLLVDAGWKNLAREGWVCPSCRDCGTEPCAGSSAPIPRQERLYHDGQPYALCPACGTERRVTMYGFLYEHGRPANKGNS